MTVNANPWHQVTIVKAALPYCTDNHGEGNGWPLPRHIPPAKDGPFIPRAFLLVPQHQWQGNLSQFTAELSKRDHQFLRRPHRSVSWRTDLIWWRRGRPVLGVVGAAAGEPARRTRPPAGLLRPRQELFHSCRGQQTAAGPGQGTWGRAPLVGV
jgi:hypothetical protein